jgi:quinol-cytochrome oxidoreductase complex cytochrome b subunit
MDDRDNLKDISSLKNRQPGRQNASDPIIQSDPLEMSAGQKKFYPDYLFEILMAALVVIETAVVLAMLFPREPGRRINFSTPFQPTPEWYFLWLFELLRYFFGRAAFIGAVILPVGFFLALLLIPFVDRSGRSGRGRARAVLIMSALYLLFIVFTLIPALRP